MWPWSRKKGGCHLAQLCVQHVQLPSAPQLPAPPYSAASQDSWTGVGSQYQWSWLYPDLLYVIYLKTVDSIAVLILLAMCNCRGVFPLCVPKNPTVHQGLSHCGMQMCINIFVRTEKKERGERGGEKRDTASPDASQLHRANEHKCHCQAEMKKKCVTAANCAGVGGQQDMFCIWRGECPRRDKEALHL